MERQLTVRVPYAAGEEGLSKACREGRLFRNDAQLEDLYKDGYRIYNYSVEEDVDEKPASRLQTLVRVFLKK